MPKRNADTYDSDSGFIEDAPSKSKKSKSNTSSTKPYSAAPAIKPSSKSLATSKTPSIDENGDKFWPINVPGTRRVTINQFKGKWMVNIREYYDANGEMKPAKKGISMPLEQYSSLVSVMPQIETALQAEGQEVPRPEYSEIGQVAKEESMKDEDGSEEAEGEQQDGKANYEATSEEDN